LQRGDAGRLQYHYIIIDFAAEYVGGELRAASDVLDARWVDYHNLDGFVLPTETRKVIQKALSH